MTKDRKTTLVAELRGKTRDDLIIRLERTNRLIREYTTELLNIMNDRLEDLKSGFNDTYDESFSDLFDEGIDRVRGRIDFLFDVVQAIYLGLDEFEHIEWLEWQIENDIDAATDPAIHAELALYKGKRGIN